MTYRVTVGVCRVDCRSAGAAGGGGMLEAWMSQHPSTADHLV